MADTDTDQNAPRATKPLVFWPVLVALSAVAAAILNWIGMPAALLLGPMVTAIVLASNGVRLQMPRPVFALAQGVIGCMIASTFPETIPESLIDNVPLFFFGVLSVIAASALLGWVFTRLRILPGTTVVWGISPGAATAMVLLADSHGADARLVAFMQYTRVIMVTAAASLVAASMGGAIPHETGMDEWFPAVSWLGLAETLAIAALGPFIARRLGQPAFGLILPIVAAAVLSRLGYVELELPHWLLALAYACAGWAIGLPFTRPLLLHALRKLPYIILGTSTLMVACLGLAVVFMVVADLDPLTAYLATSPGGADAVAIIAMSSQVDAPLVITMQLLRFLVVLFLGPVVARFVARRAALGIVAKE